jgi:hypothetical protein|tara:strand:+ start:562 stop:1197 length:636 start_codon:yes stop_codon:yes gene_type:complete
MSGIVGSFINHRGSGIVAKLGTDGHSLNSAGAGIKPVTEAVSAGGDLSFGGDTFGENKVIGANDAYSFSLETGGNTAMTISSTGEITRPLQPYFTSAIGASNDQTGDGTSKQVGTYTAPITGKYFLAVHLYMTGSDSGMTEGVCTIVTSNRTHTLAQHHNNLADFNNDSAFSFGVYTDMDADDTAVANIVASNGDKTADVQGGYYTGVLIS